MKKKQYNQKEVEALKIGSVIGSINVSNGARDTQKQIHISTNWSNWSNCDYYTIIDDGECLIIRKHYLEVPKNAKKINKSNQISMEHLRTL